MDPPTATTKAVNSNSAYQSQATESHMCVSCQQRKPEEEFGQHNRRCRDCIRKALDCYHSGNQTRECSFVNKCKFPPLLPSPNGSNRNLTVNHVKPLWTSMPGAPTFDPAENAAKASLPLPFPPHSGSNMLKEANAKIAWRQSMLSRWTHLAATVAFAVNHYSRRSIPTVSGS
jgi:hypothetical protein